MSDQVEPVTHDEPARPDSNGARARHRQYDALLEYAPDAIVIVDADGIVSEWNPAAEALLGVTRTQAVGAPARSLFAAPNADQFDHAWQQLVAGGPAPQYEFQSAAAGSPGITLSVIVAPIRSEGSLPGAVVILRDLDTPDPRASSPTHASGAPGIAHDEPATVAGEATSESPLAIRGPRWLQQHLAIPPSPGLERGVAVIDLDAFAMLVTTYGHDAADAVIAEFGELLVGLDTPGVFALWRAGTFIWTVDSTDPVSALDSCVSSLTSALEEPFHIGDERGWLTLSIGLATTADVAGGDLLSAGTDAVELARSIGGTSAVYYDESMPDGPTPGFGLASDLHHAIDHDELRLHYQPVMDFATNEIAGVEALVRWERPGIGLLPPGDFIDTAERTGQIVPLGNWVVRTACDNAPRLGSSSKGPRTMSINVSARQLQDPELVSTLHNAIVAGKCLPATIVIEVTESVLLNDLATVADSLNAIKALDVGLDLDDFGTGYSSLHYLRNLPIDRVKVDKSFVAGLGTSGADTAIVASTIALAHALGLRCVAEGVETLDQLSLLRKMGCDYAQGYLLSRPSDMDSLRAWLDSYVPAQVRPGGGTGTATIPRPRTGAHDRRAPGADRRDTQPAGLDTNIDSPDVPNQTSARGERESP
ncbi:EAL domain-containing protein [Demequina aurantiaca]|uniref:putative bifunctional diguanylate cyclase/phosphodiesterase n=1 Tax=Demequina aurantiaca TaxID=676200 RepID=UPI003D34037B